MVKFQNYGMIIYLFVDDLMLIEHYAFDITLPLLGELNNKSATV